MLLKTSKIEKVLKEILLEIKKVSSYYENLNKEANNYNDDELLKEAKQVIIIAQKVSASFLQRKLRIGYARAARLIDTLEEEGVISSSVGAEPREVFKK